MREFRVKKVVRYLLTDWEDYRGVGSVREIGEFPNVALANEAADVWGEAHKGSLVNHMDPEPDFAATLCFTSEALACCDAILRDVGFAGGMMEVHQRGHSMAADEHRLLGQGAAPDALPDPKWNPTDLLREVQQGVAPVVWHENDWGRLPYDIAAMLRRAARAEGNGEIIAAMDRHRIAVDA